MKKACTLLAFLALALPLAEARAVDFAAALGQTGESTMTYRVSAQWDFSSRWFENSVGSLSGYWDAGYTYWEGDESSSNHSLSLSPVLVYEFAGQSIRPYLEAGIGIAAFEHTRIEDNKLGSAFQFEDRLGMGLRFNGGHELGIRAIHYSNASIKKPNNGVETYSLHYRLSF